MNASNEKATLSFSDGTPAIELPIYKGVVGPDVIDIRKLYGQTGKFTYDPGFMSTASCNSKSPILMAIRVSCYIVVIKFKIWRRTVISWNLATYY